MHDFTTAVALAFDLVLRADPDLTEIVILSLQVSLSAVVIASLIGLPIGALAAIGRFPGRSALIVIINALMGLPPVVVGLTCYLLFSRSGPLGVFELLYTPAVMIIAQTILVTPIIAALAQQIIADLDREYAELLASVGIRGWRRVTTLLWDARFSLMTVALAGFGRAIAEVGAVIIVGGNINHVTRVMTTTIALETSRGNLALALALGLILISLSLAISGATMALRVSTGRTVHA